MPDEGKEIARADLRPEEIIRSVRLRSRICRYLFSTGDCWALVSVVVGLSHVAFHSNFVNDSIVFTVLAIALAVLSIAYSVKSALYRCPVCDEHLGRLDSVKPHCPSCGAKVK
jgi:hypothetical protein